MARQRLRRGLSLGLALALGAWLMPAAQRGAEAAASPAAYRITTVTTFDLKPDQNLPGSTAQTLGQHIIVEREVVADSSHFRVDIETVAPALDSGTLIVAVNGRTIVAYDSRTDLADWNILSGPQTSPSDIGIGGAMGPMAPTPSPGQSFAQYLAMLGGPASVLHPSVRITGHTRMLGHPVDIIEYGPLVGTGQSVCPRPTGRNKHPMCHSTSGTGVGHLWVATDRPVLLQYTEGSFTGLPAGMMRQHYMYRVTSLQLGSVPRAATRFTPPVAAVRSNWLMTAVIGSGDMGWFGGWPELWRTGVMYRAPPPVDSQGHRYTVDGVLIRRDTLRPIPNFLGILYYRPGPTSSGLPPAQYNGSGPYVYVQERIQIHGLPRALQAGRHIRVGHCDLWTGAYHKGAPWLALTRRRISLLVTTNALSQHDLIRYALGSLCG